jgi:hypothetical protein
VPSGHSTELVSAKEVRVSRLKRHPARPAKYQHLHPPNSAAKTSARTPPRPLPRGKVGEGAADVAAEEEVDEGEGRRAPAVWVWGFPRCRRFPSESVHARGPQGQETQAQAEHANSRHNIKHQHPQRTYVIQHAPTLPRCVT